jgi:hypothetical protein
MRAEKAIARVWDAIEELSAPYRIIARAGRNDRSKLIGLKLKIFGICACPQGCANLFSGLHRRCISTAQCHQTRQDHRPDCRVLLCSAKMSKDMVRGLVAHHKGQFIRIFDRRNQRKIERKNGSSGSVHGLKCIRRLSGAIVHDDLEIAIGTWCHPSALSLGHRLNGLDNRHELTRSNASAGASVLLRDSRL